MVEQRTKFRRDDSPDSDPKTFVYSLMKKKPPPTKYDPDAPIRPLPKTNYSKRYEDVKAIVDSGMTVPKLIEQLKNRMPTGEIFRRIRPKKLVELLGLYAYELEEKERLAGRATDAPPGDSAVPSYHHMHSSIVFDDSTQPPPPHSPAQTVDCPFLLLDVRDEEEFEQCHIQNAKCYPKSRLSRATGQFSPEILTFRGQPNKMIVLYCDFGQISGEAAQQFAQREFDNVFLLHGGLADFGVEYPNLVGPGEPPKPMNPGKKQTTQSTAAPKTPKAAPPKQPTRAAQAVAPPPGAKKGWK
jgi:centrosomal protein CEP41